MDLREIFYKIMSIDFLPFNIISDIIQLEVMNMDETQIKNLL
jgi:hypothetical protein